MRHLPLLMLLACDSGKDTAGTETDPVADCIASHPAAGSVADNADDVSAECATESGTDCDSAAFISADAASCIAATAGLDAGVADWQVWLVYHHTHSTAIWNVAQTAWTEPDGAAGGESLAIHATTGDVIELSGWEQSP